MSDLYLVWSHEHGGWWKPGSRGYTKMLGEAGRYDRAQAIAICRNALHSGLRPRDLRRGPGPEEDVLDVIRDQFVGGLGGAREAGSRSRRGGRPRERGGVMTHEVEWIDSGREPQCAPDPRFPDGMEVDISGGAARACTVRPALPCPAVRHVRDRVQRLRPAARRLDGRATGRPAFPEDGLPGALTAAQRRAAGGPERPGPL
jgi:hypothetical protein